MATKIDPPWRLDPLKRIVGVGWGSSRYATFEITLNFNFGTPATVGYRNFPKDADSTMDWSYPFVPPTITNRRPLVKTTPPVDDPVTLLMLKSYFSWGKAEVTLPTPDTGAHFVAKLGVALTRDFVLTVELPASLPAEGTEDSTWIDFIGRTTIDFPNGTHGAGEALYEHVSYPDGYDAIIAAYTAAVAEGSLASFSIEVIRTYTEGGDPRKHSLFRRLFVEMHKFVKDPDHPTAPPTDEDISSEIDGTAVFAESATSDAPVGVKRFEIEYKVKTKKLKITAT